MRTRSAVRWACTSLQQLTDAQRELALLPAFALRDERLHAAEDLLGARVRRPHGRMRAGRRGRAEFGAQPLFERRQVRSPCA